MEHAIHGMETRLEPLPQSGDIMGALTACWGKSPLCSEEPWVDTSLLGLEWGPLESLLRSLPEERVYFRRSGGKPGAPIERVGFTDQPLQDRLNAEPLHIMALDLQEVDQRFQHVQDQLIERLQSILNRTERSEMEVSVGLFLSGRKAVVPFHVDFEHNLLVHIFGHKSMHIFSPEDHTVFTDAAREKLARDMTASRMLPYQPDFEARGVVIDLKPGISTYQPPLAPHWVGSDDEPNLSLLISFFTSVELRKRMIYLANYAIRRAGISPSSMGVHPNFDGAKAGVASLARKIHRRLKPTVRSRGRIIRRT